MLVYELPENHNHEGRNVLFLDAHVEWMTEHRFQEALQRTFTQLAEPHGGACDGWGALA